MRVGANNAESYQVFMQCANEFTILIKNNDFSALSQNYQVTCKSSYNALLDWLLDLNFIYHIDISFAIFPNFNTVVLKS